MRTHHNLDHQGVRNVCKVNPTFYVQWFALGALERLSRQALERRLGDLEDKASQRYDVEVNELYRNITITRRDGENHSGI